MSRIAAFVGHSFSDSDTDVVARFLKFLDRVSELYPDFTWDHAEKAEPTVLSEKVKAKMEGKNLFIGICTIKEFAVENAKLRPVWYSRQSVLCDRTDVNAKTSDWITQEIGYAIAKDMRLILLLENGLRRPGGLQGDIEHIPFNRKNPSESFEKIMEMIRALAPKIPVPEQAASQTPVESTKESPPQVDKAFGGEPEAGWTEESYRQALIGAVFDGNNERIVYLLKSFTTTEEGRKPGEADALEAYVIWLKGLLHKNDAGLERLRELEAAHPKDARFKRYLAQEYVRYGAHEKAAELYENGSAIAKNSAEKMTQLVDAAVQKARAKDSGAEEWFRAKAGPLAKESNDLRERFRWGLLQLAEAQKDDQAWIAYQEARLIDVPDDKEARNALAWKLFEQSNAGLALYHYLRVPVEHRTENNWNNIGAAYRHLEMNGKAVAAYRESQNKGGTYAVSNLAYILIEAGFFKEAEDVCKEALKLENCEKRVAQALASIDERIKEEEEKFDKAQEAAEPEHRFLVRLGNAMCSVDALTIDGTWKTPVCTLTVTVSGRQFTASGTYQVEAGLGLRTIFGGQPAPSKQMVVSYTGSVVGRGVRFNKLVHEKGARLGLLESVGEQGFLLINEAGKSAEEMMRVDKKPPDFAEWTRQP